MTSATPAPRSVQVAFWCWVAAAILLIFGGLMMVTVQAESVHGMFRAGASEDQIRYLVWLPRGVGALLIASGLAIGYLAGRTRKGDKRFRRAAVALSYATVLLVVLFALLFEIQPVLPLFGALVLIAAAVAASRDSADKWFDAADSGHNGA